MKSRALKRFLASVLIVSVVIGANGWFTEKAEASGASVVKYQKVANSDFITCIDAEKAPSCTLEDAENVGYLFAGWYKDAELTEPIVSKNGVSGDVYAKFVPSYLAGIACQVDLNEGDTKNLRVVSLVHSEYYSAVGFNVYGRYDADGDGNNETEWLMYSHDSSKKAESGKLYKGLYAYSADGNSKKIKYPTDLFGSDAEGYYFTTMSITGIGIKTNPNTGKDVDFKDATMAIKPYWITLDGTYVEGMGEFNRVNDYYDGIINVSVNLKNATDIAVGLVNVECPDGFTLVEGECGRVFEEMKCAQRGTLVKCVGNVEGITDSANPNDVYMNLRFKTEGTTTLGANKFTVSIPDKGFCNIGEEVKTDVDAWNIKY